MRITRLAATATAAGVLALAGAAPVFAAGPSLAGITITDPGPSGGPDDVVSSPPPTTTPPETSTPTPTDTPTETPSAPSFDADIAPNVFSPGDRLTLTTMGCPTVPTVDDADGLFTGPLALKEVGEQEHQGSAVTKTDLSPTKTYHVVVTCEGVGSVTFSAVPGKKTTKNRGGQTGVVPVGGVQTGDGTSLGGGTGPALALAGGASALIVTSALTLAYRRRKAHEDA
ncbi:MAG TPA: hypothetical protein VFU43_05780 [Streptosporangiaceae bacterium]|nr:hypothetical protein [Streptosporangiaceae bacterium]